MKDTIVWKTTLDERQPRMEDNNGWKRIFDGRYPGPEAWLQKTGIRGIQDTRQIVDGKTVDIENNDKKGRSKPLT